MAWSSEPSLGSVPASMCSNFVGHAPIHRDQRPVIGLVELEHCRGECLKQQVMLGRERGTHEEEGRYAGRVKVGAVRRGEPETCCKYTRAYEYAGSKCVTIRDQFLYSARIFKTSGWAGFCGHGYILRLRWGTVRFSVLRVLSKLFEA